MSHLSADLRGLDCQSNPFLLSLQSASSRSGRHLSALYQRVSAEGGLVLLPPPQLCPRKFEERWAKAHVLLPLPRRPPAKDAEAAEAAEAAAAASAPVGSADADSGAAGDSLLSETRSASGSAAAAASSTGSDAASSPLSLPLSSWLRADATSLSGAVHICAGCIYVGSDGESAAACVRRTEPRARILLEELHYDDDFRSFRVLAIDQPLCGPKGEALDTALQAAAAAHAAHGSSGAAAAAAAAQSSAAGSPASSAHAALHRPELRSLSLHRDVLTGVLGPDVSTRSIFASPRLDFFFTDFSLAWLSTVAHAGDKAAEHVRLACQRTLLESVALIKAAPSGGSKDSAAMSAAAAASLSAAALGAFPVAEQPATAKSIATWTAARYAELEVAIQAHVHSCLHGKIFTATLARMPAHRLAAEQLLKCMQAIDAATAPQGCTLFDVGLGPELVGLVDPRPAIEQMKALNSFVTPLERLACLARVEALLLESINAAPKINAAAAAAAAAAATAAAASAAPSSSQQTRPTLHRGATLPGSSSIPDRLSSAAAAAPQPSAADGEASSSASSLNAGSSADGSRAGSATGGGSSVLASSQVGSPLSSPPSSSNLAALSPSSPALSDAAPSPLGSTTASTTIPPPALNPALLKSVSMAPPLTAPAASSSSSSASNRAAHHKSASSAGTQLSVSADDLLPLLVYVLLEARPAHLHANVAYMRVFAPGPDLLTPSVHSELLYRLANLEAAVSYIESGRLLQHIRESQAARPSTAAATAAALVPGKKPRSRMSSISLQSTKTLHLLLTPAPHAGSGSAGGGSSSGTSSRRNLFRRDSAENAAAAAVAAEGGELSADCAAARIASPLTGSSGASRALSPANGGAPFDPSAAPHAAAADDDDESSFLDDDVEGIDDEEDDDLNHPLDSQLQRLHMQQQHQTMLVAAASAAEADEEEDQGETSEADDLFSVAASKLRRSHLTSELSSNGLGSSAPLAFVPSSSSSSSAAAASSSSGAGGTDLLSPSSAAAAPAPSGPVTNAASALFGESLPDPEPLLLEGASALPAWLLNEDAASAPSHARASAANADPAAPSTSGPCELDESDPVSVVLAGLGSGGGRGGEGGRAQSMAAATATGPLTRRRSTAVVSSTLPPSLSFSSVLGSATAAGAQQPPPRVKSPPVFAPFLPRALSMQSSSSSSSSSSASAPAPAASPSPDSASSSSSAAGAVSLRQTTVAAEDDPLGALIKSKKRIAL